MIEILYPCCGRQDVETPRWLASLFQDEDIGEPINKVHIHYCDSNVEALSHCEKRAAETQSFLPYLTEEFELSTAEAFLARKLTSLGGSAGLVPDNSVQLRIVLLKRAFSARAGLGSPGPGVLTMLMALFESAAMTATPTMLVLGEFDQQQACSGIDEDDEHCQLFRRACHYFKACFGASRKELNNPHWWEDGNERLAAYMNKNHKWAGLVSKEAMYINGRLHREDGPAVKGFGLINDLWYVNGESYNSIPEWTRALFIYKGHTPEKHGQERFDDLVAAFTQKMMDMYVYDIT